MLIWSQIPFPFSLVLRSLCHNLNRWREIAFTKPLTPLTWGGPELKGDGRAFTLWPYPMSMVSPIRGSKRSNPAFENTSSASFLSIFMGGNVS